MDLRDASASKKEKKKWISLEIILLQEKIHLFQILMMAPWDSFRTKAWFNFNRCKMLANIHKNKQLAKFFHIGALCFIFFLVSLWIWIYSLYSFWEDWFLLVYNQINFWLIQWYYWFQHEIIFVLDGPGEACSKSLIQLIVGRITCFLELWCPSSPSPSWSSEEDSSPGRTRCRPGVGRTIARVSFS